MTETGSFEAPEDVLAAEFALGVLAGEARTATQRRRLADPAFAQEVEGWQMRLAGLADEVAPVEPSVALWPRIEAGLDAGGEPADPLLVLRLRRGLSRWRGATAAAAALAACLAVALVWPKPAPAPLLSARLSATAAGPAVFVALYDPARRAIVLTPAEVHGEAGRSPELWLIPPGGKPVALGVAGFDGSVQLVSSRGVRGLAAGLLAVSLEPKGGSPTGQPTGPVIATGQLSRL